MLVLRNWKKFQTDAECSFEEVSAKVSAIANDRMKHPRTGGGGAGSCLGLARSETVKVSAGKNVCQPNREAQCVP